MKRNVVSGLAVIMIAMLVFLAFPAHALASSGTYEDAYAVWEYSTSASGIVVIQFTPLVKDWGGCIWNIPGIGDVNEVSDYACANLGSRFTECALGSFVTTIKEGAFSDCLYLTSFQLGDGVTYMGEAVFKGDTALEGFSYTGDYSTTQFSVIPASTFENCSSLKEPGWLYMGCYPWNVIPDSITGIGDRAFKGCTAMTCFAFPKQLASIGNEALSSCTGLTSVTFPATVNSIGNSAFSGCTGLTRAIFTSAKPTIGATVFDNTASGFKVYYPVSQSSNWSSYTDYTTQAYCNATFDLNYTGSAAATAIVTDVDSGGHLSAPATPTRAGYKFLGWYTDAACTASNRWDFAASTVSSDSLTLYAKWTDDLTAPTAAFASIDSTGKIVTLTFSEAIDASTAISANFTGTAGTPTVNYTAGSKTLTLTYPAAISSGSAATIIAGTGITDLVENAITQTTFTEGATAGFTGFDNTTPIHTVTLSASPETGGTVSGGGTYKEGAPVTVSASVYSGYYFTNWTEGGNPVSTDAIYAFNMGTTDRSFLANFSTVPPVTIPVTGVSLNKSALTLTLEGSAETLTAVVSPESATNKNLIWSSNNTGVATVDNTGKVTGVAAGSATITVTTADGNKTAACLVTVTEGGAITTGGGGGGGGGGTASQYVASDTGSVSVTPSAGGKVGLGSDAAVNIPAGALAGSIDLTIEIEKVENPPADPSGFRIGNHVYEFTVNGNPHYNFNQPVTITLHFDPADFPAGEVPAIYYYDEQSAQWIKLGGTISGSTISVTVAHFTKYTIIADKKDEAQPETQPTAAKFTDLDHHWAKAAIEKLAGLGAVSGYPDGTFKPDNPITRAEYITMLVKALNLTANGNGQTFNDTAGHWASGSISTAAALGIVNGYGDGCFKPDNLITREEMAVIAVKAAQLEAAGGETAFNDNGQISSWAKGSVLAAIKANIIRGCPDNTFRPQGQTTRAQAVSVISIIL